MIRKRVIATNVGANEVRTTDKMGLELMDAMTSDPELLDDPALVDSLYELGLLSPDVSRFLALDTDSCMCMSMCMCMCMCMCMEYDDQVLPNVDDEVINITVPVFDDDVVTTAKPTPKPTLEPTTTPITPRSVSLSTSAVTSQISAHSGAMKVGLGSEDGSLENDDQISLSVDATIEDKEQALAVSENNEVSTIEKKGSPTGLVASLFASVSLILVGSVIYMRRTKSRAYKYTSIRIRIVWVADFEKNVPNLMSGIIELNFG